MIVDLVVTLRMSKGHASPDCSLSPHQPVDHFPRQPTPWDPQSRQPKHHTTNNSQPCLIAPATICGTYQLTCKCDVIRIFTACMPGHGHMQGPRRTKDFEWRGCCGCLFICHYHQPSHKAVAWWRLGSACYHTHTEQRKGEHGFCRLHLLFLSSVFSQHSTSVHMPAWLLSCSPPYTVPFSSLPIHQAFVRTMPCDISVLCL